MDEDFFYSDNVTPVVASFDGGDGTDTLHANFSSNAFAGNNVHSDFVDNGDGTFTVTYYDTQGTGNPANQVTVTNVENIRITINNQYFYSPGGYFVDQANPDTVITGDGDDYVFTDSGTDFVSLGMGLDEADGGTGFDFISKDLSDATTDVVWNLATNTYSGPGSVTNFEAFVTLLTGSGNDTIVTSGPGAPPGYGADTPPATPGDETISTGAGNDSVSVFQGVDTVDMGSGDDRLLVDYSDTFFVGGTTMTLVEDAAGTYSGSLVSSASGGVRGSVHFSGVEHFTIHTNEGGSSSSTVDDITTGDGDDTVFTYESNDLIRVGRGTDVVDGGAGNDGLAKRFELADDAVNVNLVANSFSGGTGSFSNIDYFIELRTTNQGDVVVTGYANDSGTAVGNDTIFTYGGDDIVYLHNDDDVVHMGAGSDRLVLDYSTSAFQGDTNMTLTATSAGTYSGTFSSIFASGASAAFTGVEHFTVLTNDGGGNGSNSIDVVRTGDGNDIISTFQSHDRIYAGYGIDTIDGGSGNDGLSKFYDPSGPAVTIDLTTNAYSGPGGIANIEYFIELKTTNSDDAIVTSGLQTGAADPVGDDLIYTFGGNDTVTVSGGDDTVHMGSGNDRLIIDFSSPSSFTGDVNMTLVGSGSYSGTYDSIHDNGPQITFSGVESFTIKTTGSAANIVTGNGDDVIYTQGANDTISSGGGNDFINGGSGHDTIDAGGGNDFVDGGAHNDTINAGAGNDTVIGGTGNDTLMGGAGTDTLNAGDGDDLLYGHAGSDTLRGQADDDTLSGGLGHDDLFGGSGADTLEGDGGNDRLYGNADNDVVNGGAGNDNVFGGGGDDHLDGSNGADILNGHAGDDVIVGGTGNDLLTGGPGADTFLFHQGHLGGGLSATDRIKDFSSAQGDLIDLHNLDADSTAAGNQAFAWIGNAAFSGTAGELRYSFAGNTTTITGDTDGDGTADFALWLTGQVALTEGDFVL